MTCCSGAYNVLCRGRGCHTHTLPGCCHGNLALLGVRVQNHPPGDDQGHQQRKQWKEVQVRLTEDCLKTALTSDFHFQTAASYIICSRASNGCVCILLVLVPYQFSSPNKVSVGCSVVSGTMTSWLCRLLRTHQRRET